jgi:hypothetical protein
MAKQTTKGNMAGAWAVPMQGAMACELRKKGVAQMDDEATEKGVA